MDNHYWTADEIRTALREIDDSLNPESAPHPIAPEWPTHQEDDIGFLMVEVYRGKGDNTKGDEAGTWQAPPGWEELRPSAWRRALGLVRTSLSSLWRRKQGWHETHCFLQRRSKG